MVCVQHVVLCIKESFENGETEQASAVLMVPFAVMITGAAVLPVVLVARCPRHVVLSGALVAMKAVVRMAIIAVQRLLNAIRLVRNAQNSATCGIALLDIEKYAFLLGRMDEIY